MTEEIINKGELKNLRFLLQSGQKLAISTKEFERVFDKIDSLEQENKELKKKIELDEVQLNSYFIGEENICKENEKYRSVLEEIREIVNEPCIEDEDCETCDSNCMCKEILDKINEVLQCE